MMQAGFRYRDQNPALSKLNRMRVSRGTADEIRLEVWLALDAERRGECDYVLAYKLLIHVAAAQLIAELHMDGTRRNEADRAWRGLCACSRDAIDGRLRLDEETYETVRQVLRTYLYELTRLTMGELAWASREAKNAVMHGRGS